MKRRIALVGFATLTAVAFAGCHKVLVPHVGVPIVWKPDSEVPPGTGPNVNLAPVLKHKFKVELFVDKRALPQEIGRNVQKKEAPLPVTTNDNVAAWATQRFKMILSRQGLNVTESGETVVIAAEIVRFDVTEANRFVGDVELRVTAKSASGDVLWYGALVGRSWHHGRDYNLENYYESLSTAFMQAAGSLASNEAFIAALPKI